MKNSSKGRSMSASVLSVNYYCLIAMSLPNVVHVAVYIILCVCPVNFAPAFVHCVINCQHFPHCTFRMETTISITPIFVVGMHHYGRRELSVGAKYSLRREYNNQYDEHAVAVYDNNSRKVGNLKRDCARLISDIVTKTKGTTSLYIIPTESATVINRRTGPQQSGDCRVQICREKMEEVMWLARQYSVSVVQVWCWWTFDLQGSNEVD